MERFERKIKKPTVAYRRLFASKLVVWVYPVKLPANVHSAQGTNPPAMTQATRVGSSLVNVKIPVSWSIA